MTRKYKIPRLFFLAEVQTKGFAELTDIRVSLALPECRVNSYMTFSKYRG